MSHPIMNHSRSITSIRVDHYSSSVLTYARFSFQMLCVNPDRMSINPNGSLDVIVGSLAKMYEKMGGEVRYAGKPDGRIFDEALREMRRAGVTDLSRIAMVGDSLFHDIIGGARCGIDTIWLPGGVHSWDLDGNRHTGPFSLSMQKPSNRCLEQLFQMYTKPTHMLWGFWLERHARGSIELT